MALTADLHRTPLYAWHAAHGARLVPFAGWAMPLQYRGILAEHRAVREGAGLFDISHMGRLEVAGPDALALLQYVTTNDVAALAPGRAQYALVCHPTGGTMDDVVVYRLPTEDPTPRYLLVVNASNRTRVLAWLREQLAAHRWRARIDDRTLALAMLALQGPAAEALLAPYTPLDLTSVPYYGIRRTVLFGQAVWLARTGYTGEDGFELLPEANTALSLWDALLELGQPCRPEPCGLGARDTLRLEAGFALYGHELRDDITPLEAGLDRFVKLAKGAFVGAEALAAQRAQGLRRRLVGFRLLDGGVPRPGCAVWAEGQRVGEVTSGTYGPSVRAAIGMAYVPPALASPGQAIAVELRGRACPAQVVALPFWPHRRRQPPRPARP
ncbi:MAG TPA: glycine cleavage system aminomethyltransferase GcvT [Chloroflexota bacterium]|jgi:aminomethyltransferase|nr:glycine cleavage system aminomethyltransferase GcvT [Chloroflexota bacterium]